MDCDICMEEWDTKNHIPRLLSCGHTFCEICIIAIFKKAHDNDTSILCPNCSTSQTGLKSEEDVKKLMKNYNLMRIVEKMEIRKTQISAIGKKSFAGKTVDKTLEATNLLINKESFLDEKKLPEKKVDRKKSDKLICQVESGKNLDFNFNEPCPKHGLQVHSYAVGTKLLFCDKCIQETNLKTSPLPSVVRDVKIKVDSTQVKIRLLKHEIERLVEFFRSYDDEFKKSNKENLDNLFSYLYKIINYNYNTAMQILKHCNGEQKAQIDQKVGELTDLSRELDEIEKELNGYSYDDDKQILKLNKDINKVFQKVNFFLNYDLELHLFSMKIGIKEEVKEKIFEIIQDSYYTDIEFVNIKGELPKMKDILLKEKCWPCICGDMSNFVASVKCQSCNCYRKYETTPNLLANPFDITNEDLGFLTTRRKSECKEFQEMIKNRSNNESKYYVIHIEWFLQWKCYVINDLSDKFLSNNKKRISSNKQIGVLPPGPIQNLCLFDRNVTELNEKTLKKGLKKNEDYIIVAEDVWTFFVTNYNGGPEIILKQNNDIYTSFVSCVDRVMTCYQSYVSNKESNSKLGNSSLGDDEDESKLDVSEENMELKFGKADVLLQDQKDLFS